MGEELLFAVSEASRGQNLDQRGDDVIRCDPICLHRIHLFLKLMCHVALEAGGRHVQFHLERGVIHVTDHLGLL